MTMVASKSLRIVPSTGSDTDGEVALFCRMMLLRSVMEEPLTTSLNMRKS